MFFYSSYPIFTWTISPSLPRGSSTLLADTTLTTQCTLVILRKTGEEFWICMKKALLILFWFWNRTRRRSRLFSNSFSSFSDTCFISSFTCAFNPRWNWRWPSPSYNPADNAVPAPPHDNVFDETTLRDILHTPGATFNAIYPQPLGISDASYIPYSLFAPCPDRSLCCPSDDRRYGTIDDFLRTTIL